MPIRRRNMDLEVPSGKDYQKTSINSDIADGEKIGIFVAPFACVVEHIDVYPHSVTQTAVFVVALATASGSTLGSVGATMSANVRNRITPSANNSLTAGTLLHMQVSATATYSEPVTVLVTYKLNKHRESR